MQISSKLLFALTVLLAAVLVFVPLTFSAESSNATVPFSDSFGSSTSNEVTNWDEDESSYDNQTKIVATGTNVKSDSPTPGHARIAKGGWIRRTIDATGFESLQLKYYWNGDTQAEESDKGVVEYCLGAGCDPASWINLTEHSLTSNTWSSQQVIDLPSSLNNSIFRIRFKNNSNSVVEHFRIEDVEITGETVGTPPPSESTEGSIEVCKVIADAQGNIVDGSAQPGSRFTLSGFIPNPPTSQGPPMGTIGTAIFTTPLTFNQDLFGSDQIRDSKCITFDGLLLGGYYYSQETFPSDGWQTPKYNDQFDTNIGDINDFFTYDDKLFDADSSNDSLRDKNVDGHIVITEQRPNRTLVVFNQYNPMLTILAYKVICASETDLPNWGRGGGPNITEGAILDFINSSQGRCSLAEDWDFQWGFDDKPGARGVDKPAGDHIGPADGKPSSCSTNCGPNTNTGPAYNQWKNFDSSTAGVTPAKVEISDLENSPKIWVRENLKNGFLPFTNPPKEPSEDDVSAEMYCHTDVLNYDNFDFIDSPKLGQTYYCIALNTPQ